MCWMYAGALGNVAYNDLLSLLRRISSDDNGASVRSECLRRHWCKDLTLTPPHRLTLRKRKTVWKFSGSSKQTRLRVSFTAERMMDRDALCLQSAGVNRKLKRWSKAPRQSLFWPCASRIKAPLMTWLFRRPEQEDQKSLFLFSCSLKVLSGEVEGYLSLQPR